MKVLFYTDPHIGLNRLSNMTATSSQRLREESFSHLRMLLSQYKEEGMLAFCLGDLFDQYSNDEAVIRQGMDILQQTDGVLAGNHDISNRSEKVSSLELLHKVYGDQILIGDWGTPSVFQLEVGNTLFVFIPHTSSQELFQEALIEARSVASESNKYRVLCLHCNYDRTFKDQQDTMLNLSREDATLALNTFHHIFMGHEHVPAEHLGGRLVVIGNTYPTSFSDISNKRVISYDTETGQYESKTTLRKGNMLWKGPLSELRDTNFGFLDLLDDLPRGEGFKAVSRLYKTSGAFAIRLTSPEQDLTSQIAEIESMESLPDTVSKDLQANRPALLPLWQELIAEVRPQ